MQEKKNLFCFHQGKLEEEIEKTNEKKKKRKRKKNRKREIKGAEEIIQWQSLDCSLNSYLTVF